MIENTGVYKSLLDQMTELIIEDCRHYEVDEERIQAFLKNELCQYPCGNSDVMVFSFNARGKREYSITYWERGQCNFGFDSKDSLGFRFLFQAHMVHRIYNCRIDEETKLRTEKVMGDLKSLFESTDEYQNALAQFENQWKDFKVPE